MKGILLEVLTDLENSTDKLEKAYLEEPDKYKSTLEEFQNTAALVEGKIQEKISEADTHIKEVLSFISYYLNNLQLVAEWVEPNRIESETLAKSYKGMITISCKKLRELIDYYRQTS